VQMLGALIGFLLGAYLADAIGRKLTFMLSAIFTIVMVLVFMLTPMDDTMLLFLGIPLSTAILMKFSPMGPFMTELYPTEVRGTGQGFCYNGGRAIGSFFPAIIGYAAQVMPLGAAIALFCTLASALMIVMLLLLPETRGRAVGGSQAALGAANPGAANP
jgi:MFS family permease